MSAPTIGTRSSNPGEILREDFLSEYELSVTALAEALSVSRQSVNELLRERRAVSPEMALRLGKLFSTSLEFWLNLQRNVDLWDAAQVIGSASGNAFNNALLACQARQQGWTIVTRDADFGALRRSISGLKVAAPFPARL